MELESLVTQLEEENARLSREVVNSYKFGDLNRVFYD